jgi:hypothetical protein
MVRDPAVHPHDVERLHRAEWGPVADLRAELDVAIKLVPGLAGANEIVHLLMQVDHVSPLGDNVGLSRGSVVPDVDNIDILLDDPVERIDPAVIVEVEKVIVGYRLAFADIGALNGLVLLGSTPSPMLSEWLGATRRSFTVSPPSVMVISNLVRDRRRDLLPDDRLDRALIGDSDRSTPLEHLGRRRCDRHEHAYRPHIS